MSADGTVVVGVGGTKPGSGHSVYRWTAAGARNGQLEWLQPPGIEPDPAAASVVFVGVTPDGRSLLGTLIGQQGSGSRIFRWSEANGIADVGLGRGGVSASVSVSDDGEVVIATDEQQAFRWTSGEGRVSLGQLPGDVGNEATGMSADGRVIIGNSTVRPDMAYRVFRWTGDTGMVGLDLIPESPSCQTRGLLSGDGSILVGVCKAAAVGQAQIPFRWTEATGTVAIPVTDLPYALVTLHHLSPDGTVLVGTFAQASPPLPGETPRTRQAAFRWRPETGLEILVPPEGLTDCLIFQTASRDGGTVIAGCSGPNGAAGTVKWDAQGDGVILQVPPGSERVVAMSVTADGHVVTGAARHTVDTTNDQFVEAAVLWDDRRPEVTMMADFLTGAGLPAAELATVRLETAKISEDGRTLSGDATDADRKVGWLAHLP